MGVPRRCNLRSGCSRVRQNNRNVDNGRSVKPRELAYGGCDLFLAGSADFRRSDAGGTPVARKFGFQCPNTPPSAA